MIPKQREIIGGRHIKGMAKGQRAAMGIETGFPARDCRRSRSGGGGDGDDVIESKL